MDSEALKKITDQFNEQGEMAFLEGATDEQIKEFENKHKINLPEDFKIWLRFSDGGECFLPAGIQFYGVAHKPVIDVEENDRPDDSYVVIGALASGDPILCQKETEVISIYNHEAGCIEDDEVYENFEAFLSDLYDLLGIGG
ncbi:SMI1/KNR4 family protein [Oliverpabstia intestinalis]|uniref:SMI1/KNR4 family protein n=1 Tax=Oliverpabstia intestinalis TaxID=2606633 RepID=UPI003F8AD5FA